MTAAIQPPPSRPRVYRVKITRADGSRRNVRVEAWSRDGAELTAMVEHEAVDAHVVRGPREPCGCCKVGPDEHE